jgi:peptide/nickel transport system substrate-binding protein
MTDGYGGTLRVGLTGGSSSDTLDPHQGLNYLDTARAQSLYEPLVQLDPQAGSGSSWPAR